jgi:hypothetical protein
VAPLTFDRTSEFDESSDAEDEQDKDKEQKPSPSPNPCRPSSGSVHEYLTAFIPAGFTAAPSHLGEIAESRAFIGRSTHFAYCEIQNVSGW